MTGGRLVRWRLALRIARRDALRHRGRSLLVLAMVGLPILAVVAADTLYRTRDVTPVEALPGTLGAADAALSGESRGRVWADPETGAVVDKSAAQADPPWTRAEVAAALPPGARVTEAVIGGLSYRTDLGYAQVRGQADDLSDPMRSGAAHLLEGRFPAAADEVAVSPEVADRGVAVGNRLALTRDDVPVTVVGVVRSETEAGPLIVLAPAAAGLLEAPSSWFYATVPGGLDWPAVQGLNERGLVVVSRPLVEDPPPPEQWAPPGAGLGSSGDAAGQAVLALVVASVVIEIVLLAGPAFAVGARRQRRDLALIGAAGGAPADLRRVVLASGMVLGGGAALVGAFLGVGLAAVAVPFAESRWGTTFGPFDVPVLDVLLTVGVGVVAGLAAAYVPARQAARTDVVTTLAGRRGQVRTSWRSPVLGLLLAAAGMALVILGAQGSELGVAGGAVLLILGVVAATPWLVGLLAPLGRRLSVSGRLAVRDATRNRGRTAPAVAAVMATVAGVTALAIGSASDSAQAKRAYQPQGALGSASVFGGFDAQGWDAAVAILRAQAPDRPVHRIQGVGWDQQDPRDLVVARAGCTGGLEECRWDPGAAGGSVTAMKRELIVADAAALRAIDPAGLPATVYQALLDGRVVVFGSGAVDERGEVTLRGARYDGAGNGTVVGTVTLPAVEQPVPAGEQVLRPALVIVPPVLADRLPVSVGPTELITGGPDAPVSPAEEERVREALVALAPSAGVYVERGWTDELAVPRLILFGLGAALVLVATLTATGLALTDARPDFATLAAVGAAPRVRRFVAMGSAAVVGGVGAVLGVLVGLAPGIAVAVPLTSNDYGQGAHPVLDIPWAMLAGVGLAVPLLAVAVTGLVVRSRLPMARRLAV